MKISSQLLNPKPKPPIEASVTINLTYQEAKSLASLLGNISNSDIQYMCNEHKHPYSEDLQEIISKIWSPLDSELNLLRKEHDNG